MLKKNFILLIFFLLTNSVTSQEWVTNFDEAKSIASTNNLNILLVFQGSDWCGLCIKLDKNVWSTERFQNLVKDYFVMVKADFPRRKSNQLSKEMQMQNSKLADSYNRYGYFPLVVLLNPEGKLLGKIGYEKISPIEYFNKLKAFE